MRLGGSLLFRWLTVLESERSRSVVYEVPLQDTVVLRREVQVWKGWFLNGLGCCSLVMMLPNPKPKTF